MPGHPSFSPRQRSAKRPEPQAFSVEQFLSSNDSRAPSAVASRIHRLQQTAPRVSPHQVLMEAVSYLVLSNYDLRGSEAVRVYARILRECRSDLVLNHPASLHASTTLQEYKRDIHRDTVQHAETFHKLGVLEYVLDVVFDARRIHDIHIVRALGEGFIRQAIMEVLQTLPLAANVSWRSTASSGGVQGRQSRRASTAASISPAPYSRRNSSPSDSQRLSRASTPATSVASSNRRSPIPVKSRPSSRGAASDRRQHSPTRPAEAAAGNHASRISPSPLAQSSLGPHLIVPEYISTFGGQRDVNRQWFELIYKYEKQGEGHRLRGKTVTNGIRNALRTANPGSSLAELERLRISLFHAYEDARMQEWMYYEKEDVGLSNWIDGELSRGERPKSVVRKLLHDETRLLNKIGAEHLVGVRLRESDSKARPPDVPQGREAQDEYRALLFEQRFGRAPRRSDPDRIKYGRKPRYDKRKVSKPKSGRGTLWFLGL